MELNQDFRVGISVPDAWKVLTDVERIAPFLPGAQLQEVEGDEYRGVVKVKVGPITAQYKGVATFLEQDEQAGRVVIKASGRDTRGQGNASAVITATMTPDGDGTKVTVATDLTVTGKVAQFGRGVMAEVSAKLMGQFADALEADLARSGGTGPAASGSVTSGPGAEGAASEPGPGAPSPEPDSGKGAPAGEAASVVTETEAGEPSLNGAAAEKTTLRRIDSPEAEPVDLLAVAGGSTMKRLGPVVGVVLVVLVVLARRRSRKVTGLAKLASHLPIDHVPALPRLHR